MKAKVIEKTGRFTRRKMNPVFLNHGERVIRDVTRIRTTAGDLLTVGHARVRGRDKIVVAFPLDLDFHVMTPAVAESISVAEIL